jgi:hypothetical protein
MAESNLLTGLYAVGVQAAAVIVLVYVVVAMIGARASRAPITSHEPTPTHPRRPLNRST